MTITYSPIRIARVLLFQQTRLLLVYSKKSNHWELPGGKVENRETYLTAAQRELREETGLSCNITSQYVLRHRVLYDSNEVRHMSHFFRGTHFKGTEISVQDTKEISKATWFYFKDLPTVVESKTLYILEQYCAGLKEGSTIEIISRLG